MNPKSTLINKQSLLPGNSTDDGLKEFLDRNLEKKVIVIQGLGFVGSVMCLVCAHATKGAYAVIGVDLPTPESYWKIKSINEGNFPVLSADPKIDEYFNDVKRWGNFYATYDSSAFSQADFILVDINLDVLKKTGPEGSLGGYDVDLAAFRKAITSIGRQCKSDALILIETTVPPGTCEKVVWPILQDELQSRGLTTNELKLGHSYERVMPGPEYIDSINNLPRVYSGINQKSSIATKEFLQSILGHSEKMLTQLHNTNASEMAKVLENSYRAFNISFVEEWSRFAEEAGVNLFQVIDAIRQRKTHSNLMYPGIGVGGYCLTKDPLLASWSRKVLFKTGKGLLQSEKAVEINDQMPISAFNFFVDHSGSLAQKKILILGVAYRGDIGDARYTPVSLFYEKLLSLDSEIILHDPFIPFWDEKNVPIQNDLGYVISLKPDFIIITSGHSIYKQEKVIDKILSLPKLSIYDLLGYYSEVELSSLRKKHNVFVIGSGDIFYDKKLKKS